MIQVIKFTYHDDASASTSMEIMVCSSIETAQRAILKAINKAFEGEWASLKGAAKALNYELSNCSWDEDCSTFVWFDNGKGESYSICKIDENKVDVEFQNVGVVS